MRKFVIFLFAFLALARPVAADEGLIAQQQQIKQQLAQVATAITVLDDKIAKTQAQLDSTQQKVDRERGELKALARTVYAQPASPLLVLFSANSPSDALTRYSDLKVAGERASATKTALDRDTVRLRSDKANLEKDREKQVALAQDLSKKYQELGDAIAAEAARSQTPVPDQTQTPTGPATHANTSPAPSAPPAAGGSIQQIILDAFASQGPPAQAWALRIAKCESGYNPRAVNASSGAAGLFQFLPSTWRSMPQGKAGKDVFDPVANAQAAAYYYSTSGGSPWVCQ